MKSRGLEVLEIIKSIQTNNYDRRINDYTSVNEECEYEISIIEKDLDRLEKLEKIFSDSHICEIKARFDEIECSADKCDNCPLGIGDGICLKKTFERKWELQKENQELIKKADCCLWKDCNKISQENQELKDTNMKYAKLIDDFQSKNMRLEKTIKKAIELLSIDGKGTKKQVLNLLKEVLEE